MYADSTVWNRRFEREGDLDWGGLWTDPFIEFLHKKDCVVILDLGCGTGNDVRRLAQAGFQVTGLDYSQQALDLARSKDIPATKFIQADMAEELPFPECHFDAVTSNVALHMFDDSTTQYVIEEVRRIIRPEGPFIFHINSTEDRQLRVKRRAVLEELSKNRVREEDGQTVHFFSQSELESLFDDWSTLQLEHVEIPHGRTGEPFKKVWRGIAIN